MLRSQVNSLKKELTGIRGESEGLKEESLVLKKKLQKRLDVATLDKSQAEGSRNHSAITKSFFVTEKIKVNEESKALDGLILNLRSHDPKDGINLLKSFIKNEVKEKEAPIYKKAIKSNSLAKQQSLHPSLMDTAEVVPQKN